MMSVPTINSPAASSPSTVSIFHLIHDLHRTVSRAIDSALTWDQLNSPPVQYTLVRPIVNRYAPRAADDGPRKTRSVDESLLGPERGEDGGDKREGREMPLGAVLYALMVNRVQFITLSAGDLSYAAMQTSRAAFCELLAMKIIRSSPHADDEAELVDALVRGWCAFDGAPEDVWESFGDERQEVQETSGSALELAIVSRSKRFLSLPLIQHLINEIYLGHLIYLPVSHRSLISDSYISDRTRNRRRASHNATSDTRPNPPSPYPIPFPQQDASTSSAKLADKAVQDRGEVFVYNPYEAGWLDHQRLRVPKWRNWVECWNFAVLLVLFIATLSSRDVNNITPIEIISAIFTFGFILDEFAASQEHGWTVYAANAWNAFDLAYISVFLLYLALRGFALITHSPATSDLAFDILACGACILFPRLVFFLIKDHVVIIALKAMVGRFISFMGLTVLAFSGICFCLWTLGRGTWTVKQIIWLMLQIWFGSSYLGFSASESFHPIFGPAILISYAALCNVLLITILIAILSNKFAEINGNAQEERVVRTVEGVKSDPIFSYMPPLNLVAFTLLSPLSWVCKPRTLHRINVFCVRAANFPALFLISAYERWSYRSGVRGVHLRGDTVDGVMENAQRPKMFDSWLGGGSEVLIASVFEVTPPAPPAPARDAPPSDSDSDLEEAPVGPEPEVVAPPRPKYERARSSGFDSPLARLFGGVGGSSRRGKAKEKEKAKAAAAAGAIPSGPVGKAEQGSRTSEDVDGGAHTAAPSIVDAGGSTVISSKNRERAERDREVEMLKAELADVRASQLRMEEMLSKVLNPAGEGK